MLGLFDCILTEAPEYEQNDIVSFPLNTILDWPMGTPAGLAMLTNPKINAQFKKMFDVWANFLGSPASTTVLSTESDG